MIPLPLSPSSNTDHSDTYQSSAYRRSEEMAFSTYVQLWATTHMGPSLGEPWKPAAPALPPFSSSRVAITTFV